MTQEESQDFGKDLYQQMLENPMLFGYFFFPEHFRDKPPKFHVDIMTSLMKDRYVAIAAPRGSAKSTLVGFLYAFHAIMFKRKHFIVIIGNTENKAKEHLDAIKRELKDNKMLKNSMSKVALVKDNEVDSVFRHADGFEVKVLCKGVEQIPKVRGSKFVAYRPDLIIVDDADDDELVRSPERRVKLKEDFDTALLPAGDFQTCQYVVIGTILHDDSQLAKLLKNDDYKEFRRFFYEALNEETNTSLWPERWTVKDLENIKKTKPEQFAKEYQNNPVAGKQAKYKKEDFRYWRERDDKYDLLDLEGNVVKTGYFADCRPAMSCDLAWETRRDADDTVIMGGILTPDSESLVYNYIAERGMRPDKFARHVFKMFEILYRLTGEKPALGMEKAMLEKVTKWNLKQVMQAKNEYITIKNLSWESDKIKRIDNILEPKFSNHVIYFRKNMGDLEYQITRFPHGTKDDLCIAEGTKIATLFGDKNIEDIKTGDYVITPNGLNIVKDARKTGIKEVISKFGLSATKDHLVVDVINGLTQLGSICYNNLSLLNLKELILWRYKKLLYSMEKNTTLWVEKENITSVIQVTLKDERILKDYTLRFGNFITEKAFLKAITFTIKTAILLITTYLIWNVYLLANIIRHLDIMLNPRKNILRIYDHLRKYGTLPKKVTYGTKLMEKIFGKIKCIKHTFVNGVIKLLNHVILKTQSSVVATTPKIMPYPKESIQNPEYVQFVENPLQQRTGGVRLALVPPVAEQGLVIKHVYNLTVDKAHLYYANNILVSNCDCLNGLMQMLKTPRSRTKAIQEDDGFDILHKFIKNMKTPPKARYIFGKKTQRFEIPHIKTIR